MTSETATRRATPPVGLRLVASLLAVAFAFPAAYLVWRNITEGSDPADALLSQQTLDPLLRTLQLAVLVSAAAMVLGTALAWLTTRTDLPFRRLWRVVLPIPLVFPTFIGAAAFIRSLNPGGLANDILVNIGVESTPELKGLFGSWLVLTLFTYPYVYLPVAARLRQLSASLEENARVLGDSPHQTFWRIVVPQIASAVGAGTLLVFLYTLSDFGAVQLMRYDTLTRAIASNQLSNRALALALSLILLVLAGLVVVAERIFSRRLPDATQRRGQRAVEYHLGAWRWPALGFVVFAAANSVGAPMLAMIDWASEGIRRATGGGRPLTIDADKVVEATANTVQVSALSAIAAIISVLPIALLVGRYRSRAGVWAHAVVISTFALPGILIALSMRFWVLQSDIAFNLFNDTMALLVFSYVVRFGSLAMGVALIAVRAVPTQLHDAARTLGARRARRFGTVDLPLMAPGLLAGAGLVLLSVMKELPIALYVSPIGFSTLTTRIFSAFEDAFVAEAGIMAVVLVSLSFVLSWFLVIRRAEHL